MFIIYYDKLLKFRNEQSGQDFNYNSNMKLTGFFIYGIKDILSKKWIDDRL